MVTDDKEETDTTIAVNGGEGGEIAMESVDDQTCQTNSEHEQEEARSIFYQHEVTLYVVSVRKGGRKGARFSAA